MNLKIKENMIIQRLRIRWLKDEDSNNKFFHRVMKQSIRRNHIGGMITNGATGESVEEVKREVFLHFAGKFVKDVPCRSELEEAVFKKLSYEERDHIESKFLEEEVKEAISNCDGSKSPSLDGYSFLFVKKY